jgi:hypothetical protein
MSEKLPNFTKYEKLMLENQAQKQKIQDLEDIVFRSQLIDQAMNWLWNEHDIGERQTIGFQNAFYLLIDSLTDTLKQA